MDGRSKAMPGWKGKIGEDVVAEVVSGVISPTLENKPIGFLRAAKALEEGQKLVFFQEGRRRELEGEITVSPFVKPTSRKKMKNFLD